MKDKDIKLTSEHPEADVKHVVRGILRQGLKPVPSKASISLRVDADVLEWLKAQGPGYQTRINAVLRAFKNASERSVTVERAWLEEAQRRQREVIEGKVQPVPGERVFTNLRSRLKR
mgnify:CR=1 FL=1